ncbi:hypothetical protein [Sphingomonas profundi]|uniref:hypothetical protein n=1 Tax=Alterirhizorhabdus profundi TaxID=2681549 RepID=UPI0018D166A1|nr:hypothetical protein [Sphingomonas profundi]
MDILTPYDEFPVHQAPQPFSHIPSTDLNWDEGYYFAVMNPDEQVMFCTGFRINPNTDMIGGYALINVAGVQRTFRFSRCWRREFALSVGPFRVEIIEPLKVIRLVLDENGSGIAFDFLWKGTSPAFLEEHHTAISRGRRTTDQRRYSQPGAAEGWLQWPGRRWDVGADGWVAVRDHSWGLYVERPPIAPDPRWLPPRREDGPVRALRFWTVFRTGDYSGFYHLHEDADGVQRKFNDVFGTPFAGRICKGWDAEAVTLAAGSHALVFEPGKKLLKSATLNLTDEHGRAWRQVFETASPPWVTQTMGYTPGSWKDGGTFHSYHGSEALATEWDHFDFSAQPFDFTPYGSAGKNQPDSMRQGADYSAPIYGVEYLSRITTYAPDGSTSVGAGQIELFINGAYRPYGFS